jgi:hypothetical protein
MEGAALNRISFLVCKQRRVYTFGRWVGNTAVPASASAPRRTPRNDGESKQRKKPQGHATSFVVTCAFGPVAGALGYKLDRKDLRSPANKENHSRHDLSYKNPPFAQNANDGAPAKAKKSRFVATAPGTACFRG